MKLLMLAAPAVAMFAGAALAQTDTTTSGTADTGATMDATGGTFGTNWPLSVGTTFFTDTDSATLRTSEEITTGWQSLSQEDRDMIKADCTTFMAAHGDAAATDTSTATGTSTDTSTGTSTDAAAGTDTSTSTGTSTDTAGTAADTSTTGTADTGAATTGTASTGTDAATTAPAGYDLAEMKAICEAVGKL